MDCFGDNMKKGSLLFLSLLLCVFCINNTCVFAQHCPPCTEELNSLNAAKEKAREASINSKNAADALLSASIAHLNASFRVEIARGKMESACGYLGTLRPGCQAAIDALTLTEDEALKASNVFRDAMKTANDAIKTLDDAIKALKAAKEEYDNCMKTVPAICKICRDGNIVVDESQDPGMCLKCEGGLAVPDDSEDPGMCKKCVNGVVVNDDSQFIGNCKQCVNGEPENWDNPNVTRCKKCVNGDEINVDGPDPQCGPGEICCGGFCTNTQTDPVNCGSCGNICASGEECCNGNCQKPKYEYTVTTTVITCNSSNTEISPPFQTDDPGSVTPGCVSTGQLTYSYGVCTGGSVKTVCTTAPARKPCQ